MTVLARDTHDVRLAFESTLSRRLVHKAAVEQVLLTDATRLGDHEFAVGGQLPRSHAYYSDSVLEVYDQLAVLEVGRQGVVLVSHEYLGVPDSSQFIFSDLGARVHDVDALRRTGQPKEIVLLMSLAGERRRRGELAAAEFSGDFHVGGRVAMSMHGSAVYFNRERYQTLRRHMQRAARPEPSSEPPVPLPPEAVGRLDPGNVVIGEPAPIAGEPNGYETELVVRESHATFFDHPLDHVPGALLIEGCRQSALVAAARTHALPPTEAYIHDYSARYERLAELGGSVRCHARVGEARTQDGRLSVPVDIALMQWGSRIAESRFVLVSGR